MMEKKRDFNMQANEQRLIDLGLAVLDIEAKSISSLRKKIDQKFVTACRILLECEGRVVVTGIGKSGHIARKISATFSSTGTPSFFLHPAEASHGDLGMITKKDVVLAISNSGETEEIINILPHLKRLDAPFITLTGFPESTLAKMAEINLDVSVSQEACPLGLAPTASTTATLAMGDALAIALLEARGFTAEDFAKSHPGGRLGKQPVLIRIEDVMHKGDKIPCVHENTLLSEALLEMTRKTLGMTTVVKHDAPTTLVGVFTDGDLRRTIERNIDIHKTPINQVMTKNCKTVSTSMLAAEATRIMETYKITGLPVLDSEGKLVGALNIHDLFRMGAM